MKHPPRTVWAAALLAAVWLTPSPAVRAQTPIGDYQFQNVYTSTGGTLGPLTTISGGTYTFQSATVNGTTQQVLSVSNGGVQTPANPFSDANQGVHSIVLNASVTISGTSITKIFDFKNLSTDAGLYISDASGLLQFIDNSSAVVAGGTGTAPVLTGTYFQLPLTRAAAGLVTGYQDGAQAFQFTDTGNLATLGNLLTIYKDEGLGLGGYVENTNGNLARLRLYNEALTPAQVAALVPEPSTWALLVAGGAALGWVALRRRRTA